MSPLLTKFDTEGSGALFVKIRALPSSLARAINVVEATIRGAVEDLKKFFPSHAKGSELKSLTSPRRQRKLQCKLPRLQKIRVETIVEGVPIEAVLVYCDQDWTVG